MILKNALIVSSDLKFKGAVKIDNGVISNLFQDSETLPPDSCTIDCGGNILAPGFIDIHTHGAMGFDWSDGSVEADAALAQYKLKEGVTSVIATTMTLPHDQLKKAASALREYIGSEKKLPGAKIPGIHLEGPYLNPGALGAQNPDYARKISPAEVFEINDIFPVAKISLAPEMPDMLENINILVKNGIAVGAGHSKASFARIKAAAAAGLDQLCHFGNQMTPLHHREIGMVGAGLYMDSLFVEVICDFIHLCPEMAALTAKVKPEDKLVLITDTVRPAGFAPGRYESGGLAVEIRDNKIFLAGSDTIAGSMLKLNHGLRNLVSISGKPLEKAIKCVTSNPAAAVRLTGTGEIRPGFAADLVLLDDQLEVLKVWVDGQAGL